MTSPSHARDHGQHPAQPCRAYSTTPSRGQRSFPAWFVRGGTSNGLLIHRDHLPRQSQWGDVLPHAMGSPDPYSRQLDGMGSGISSTSKVMVLAPPSRPDVDVDYTFVQVGIKDGKLDMAGNCGNMSSAIGPVAWDWGLVQGQDIEQDNSGEQWASARLFNTNTSKVLVSKFKVEGNPPRYCPDGNYVLDGVPGKASQITMSFMDPAGAKTGKALPTGNPVDVLHLSDGSTISASLVDVSNPGVFVSAKDVGLGDVKTLAPDAVEGNATLKARLEDIRRAGASRMGLDPEVESIPKVVILFPSGDPSEVDIRCLAMSMGQAHKAVPLTLALCLGVASQLPGTIAAELAGESGTKSAVTIGHPSGKLDIGMTIRDGTLVSAELLRTSRVLMKGDVCY